MDLYFIVGYNNVSDWKEEYFDDIDIDSLCHETFDTEDQKQSFINGMFYLDNRMHLGSGNYVILSEEQFFNLKKQLT